MTVTILIPGPLRAAVDGRRKVDLGVPATADVSDVLQSLFALYPKLQQHIAREDRQATASGLQIRVLFEQKHPEPMRLRDGQKVYLVADQPRRLTDQAAEG